MLLPAARALAMPSAIIALPGGALPVLSFASMRRMRWRRTVSVLAAGLLAAFAVALAEDAFFHTDDGCVVEQHCLACRWHQGSTAAAVSFAAPVARLEPGALIADACHVVRLEGARPETPARAPPLA
jgi:hypothetical protein